MYCITVRFKRQAYFYIEVIKWGEADYVFENVEIIILMFRILLLLLELQATLAYEVMFALNCGSFSYTMISTKYFNYTVVNRLIFRTRFFKD